MNLWVEEDAQKSEHDQGQNYPRYLIAHCVQKKQFQLPLIRTQMPLIFDAKTVVRSTIITIQHASLSNLGVRIVGKKA